MQLDVKRALRTGVIAMSLFGSNGKYLQGALENAVLVRHVYPGWVLRFYVDDTVNAGVLGRLRDMGSEVVMMPRAGGDHGMAGLFWRFGVADDLGFARWMVRDADSRLNVRERGMVDEWMDSGLAFHTVRDHPFHRRPIMGCAFGGVRGAIGMGEIMGAWTKKGAYGDDEEMLAKVVWPLVRERTLVHDAFGAAGEAGAGGMVRRYGKAFENYRFVGERFDVNGVAHPGDRAAIIEAVGRVQD